MVDAGDFPCLELPAFDGREEKLECAVPDSRSSDGGPWPEGLVVGV